MICVVNDKTAESAREGYAKHWVRYFGHPELLICDQGTEFTGGAFTTYVAEGGCLQHCIDSQSPWQNGRTERAGGSFKEDLRDIIHECGIVSESEFEVAITTAMDARNRFANRSGYSAHQRVFGSEIRLPGSMLSDHPIDRGMVALDPMTNFRRTEQIR